MAGYPNTPYTQSRRARLKARGMCYDCARRPAIRNRVRCRPCGSKAARAQSARNVARSLQHDGL